MSDTSNKQVQHYREQIYQLRYDLGEKLVHRIDPTAEIKEKLQQIQTIIEAPELSREMYDHVMNLISEVRSAVVTIIQHDEAKVYHQQALNALQESKRLNSAANKKLKQYALSLQKRQRQSTK